MSLDIERLTFAFVRNATGWKAPRPPAAEELRILATHQQENGKLHVQFEYVLDEYKGSGMDSRQIFSGWIMVNRMQEIEQSSLSLDYVGQMVRWRFDP